MVIITPSIISSRGPFLIELPTHKHTDKNIGWLAGGDFNEILYDEDKHGGFSRSLNQINAFCNALNANSLVSLKAYGPIYTWDNKWKGPHRILEWLDRFVANEEYISTFPNHWSSNLDFFNSDHRPFIINTNPQNSLGQSNTWKPFNFEHKWLLEQDYSDNIKIICTPSLK